MRALVAAAGAQSHDPVRDRAIVLLLLDTYGVGTTATTDRWVRCDRLLPALMGGRHRARGLRPRNEPLAMLFFG